MRIIGIDPSLRNFGLVKGEIDLDTMEWTIFSAELVKTEKGKTKTVRKNSDDYDRCRILFEGLQEAQKGAQMAFVEMPVGSQSAAAMLSYGACIALIASLDIPVIQVTPSQVKQFATGDKHATKEEMIAWATNKFPDVNWLRSGQRFIAANEHLADAVGAVNAGLKTDDFKALRTMMQSMTASLKTI